MAALLSIFTYFTLNSLVTVSNKSIVSQTGSPYLLTATHAATSFISTTILRQKSHRPNSDPNTALRILPQHHRLTIVFLSFLYTVNIAMSNLTLGLVDLSEHQLVRATAPALTVILSAMFYHQPLSAHSAATYLSLASIVLGVVIAVTESENTNRLSHRPTTIYGLSMTLFGAVLAVVKTILTYHLQKKTDFRGVDLIHRLSPLAFVQSLILACWADEISIPNFNLNPNFTLSKPRNSPVASGSPDIPLIATAITNALLAAALNLSSFDANWRCGAVSMAVAANLKIVGILAFQTYKEGTATAQVVWGTALTVVGGVAFAVAQRGDNERQRRKKVEPMNAERREYPRRCAEGNDVVRKAIEVV